MTRRPKGIYPKGAKTVGDLDFEVTLRFNIRPAGWAGNDHRMLTLPFLYVKRAVPLLSLALRGGEALRIVNARWRRPGETWQKWEKP